MRGCILAMTLLISTPIIATEIENNEVDGFDKAAINLTDIKPVLNRIAKHPAITLQQLGRSYHSQPIYALDIGSGTTKVMMWSQMHGDENTATAALMDFLDFITLPENANWLQSWQDKLTLRIIPMINPDGAKAQTRHNAQGIDLNRDAKALRTPEGQTLMRAAKEFKPDFGFNLHDQNAYYGAGKKGNQATISVLAPAYNDAREINTSRGEAMQLIAHLAKTIETMIPGHLAKYNDSYSYRSFGDTFSEMGIRTILIESGAYPNDPHRQVARKVNRVLYKEIIDTLQNGTWKAASINQYNAIPFNASNNWVDLLIDDVNVQSHYGDYKIDIAINNKGNAPRIKELGDISSIRRGYTQIDANKLVYNPGKGFSLTEPIKLNKRHYKELLKQGYSCFSGDFAKLDNRSHWPVYWCQGAFDSQPKLHASAAFLLYQGQTIKYAVLGSELIKLN
ncbi:peptidase M14 [Pseudoalteromonas sp. CO302Y]|uniref:M14 family metallopeptidase n=1 Tax=unclassified Pseudoalteromonas TaxID=194690 RepID=UPI001023F008|nr:peptidase M14 [Pseudoalteromonas sp. CO302Y]RZG08463.1 peptidase M14 [Pseudoalteromonas sp. CO133X]